MRKRKNGAGDRGVGGSGGLTEGLIEKGHLSEALKKDKEKAS